MGFLDHSTNNIIVDAVLTDTGRQRLASSLFSVAYFSLGDDEIDYDIIKQFGRNVGKEKIEKNTPVLEAFTQSNLGQKYKLTSINNETLTHLPVINITGTTNNLVSFSRSLRSNVASIDVTLENTQTESIPFQIADDTLIVEIDTKFLELTGVSTPSFVNRRNVAKYKIAARRDTESKISSVINVRLKSISQKDFNKYSIGTGTYIRSFIKITGMRSGAQKIVEVRIS